MILQLVISVLVVLTVLIGHIISRMRIANLKSKSVVISGCDSGFGHLLALRLVERGMQVFAGCYTDKGCDELKMKAKRINTTAGRLVTLSMDVTSSESMQSAAKLVGENVKSDGIWAIVCNAGILGNTGPDDWLTVDDYYQVMNVNTFGVIRMCHSFKRFVKRQCGRIIMIASISGRTPRPTVGPYCVSKHALEAYGDVIRHEMKDFSVSVHILEPGFFATNITQTATNDLDKVWKRVDAETKVEYGQEYFEQYKSSRFTRLSASSSDLSPVLDAYEHAITARFPKIRYWVGIDALLFYIPLATLPTFAQDALISFQRRNRMMPAAVVKTK